MTVFAALRRIHLETFKYQCRGSLKMNGHDSFLRHENALDGMNPSATKRKQDFMVFLYRVKHFETSSSFFLFIYRNIQIISEVLFGVSETQFKVSKSPFLSSNKATKCYLSQKNSLDFGENGRYK